MNNISNCMTGNWTKQEDKILTELVKKFGVSNWNKVSEQFPGRISRQCRERWFKHLDPSVNKSKWTLEEDLKIVRLFCQYGNSWSSIAKEIDGRTNDAIKNRFNSNLSKKLHEPPFCNILDEFMKKEDKKTGNGSDRASAAEDQEVATRPDCKKNGETEVDLLPPATAPESEPLSPVH